MQIQSNVMILMELIKFFKRSFLYLFLLNFLYVYVSGILKASFYSKTIDCFFNNYFFVFIGYCNLNGRAYSVSLQLITQFLVASTRLGVAVTHSQSSNPSAFMSYSHGSICFPLLFF